ncbi:hypothetical protein DID80_07555 [Candidatus Marinamargulisbacteria bacterium SCGC AAA071-K20]|nr:hypothetical protein DID80_07555 [Candidatus Marinamargulisbacteria bacterium SCGC AAA071-K20]
MGVLPILAGENGVILEDIYAHRTLQEASELCRTRGAKYEHYEHNNLDHLTLLLKKYKDAPTRIIVVDGVYSMNCTFVNLPKLCKIAKEHNAIIYMDDAHGFGILGESPDANSEYGYKGNGIHSYFGLDLKKEPIFYIAGLSKAYSSHAAFITCNSSEMRNKIRTASPYIFSGPVPNATISSSLTGLKVNSKIGNDLRNKIYKMSKKLVDGIRNLGFTVENTKYFPIVYVVLGNQDLTIKAANKAWDVGLLLSPGVFPIVPVERSGLRFSVTSDNTDEQIEIVLGFFRELSKEISLKKTTEKVA